MNKYFLWILSLVSSLLYSNQICLTMTVQNDAAVVRKCLESARKHIDYVSVADLGCTDRTIEEIEAVLKEYKIPYNITLSPSQEIDPKTLAIDAAKQYLQGIKVSLDETYLLLVEPETVCVIAPDFNKAALDQAVYSIKERSSTLSCYYDAPKLIRASYKGDLDCSSKLNTLHFDVNEHPAYKMLKLERAAVRLKKRLKNDPENGAALFELASVHYGLSNYEQAIPLYQKRAEKEEKKDEVWLSCFRIGECYEKLGKWTDAQYWYLEAYRRTPSRAEPLFKLTNYYRLKGENELAYLFAKEWELTSLSPHFLYPIPTTPDYQRDEELSICSYYTTHKEEGFLAANRLLLKRDIPWHLKNQTFQNVIHYVKNIRASSKIPISIERPLIRPGSEERYFPLNPSIIKSASGYDVICRTVNYSQIGSLHYTSHDLDGAIRTRNFFLRFDKEFSLLSQQEIRENLPRKKHRKSFNIIGLEDCRLFSYDNALWFSCTTLDTNPQGVQQICLCRLPNGGFGDTLFVEQLIPLLGPDPKRCEKNWLPLEKNGEIYMIYSSDPLILYKPNLQTGVCETVASHTQKLDLTHFRGSAGPIEWDQGYLIIVHEVVYKPNGTRLSLHRLVHFDDRFHVKALSLPFTFAHLGVEYCCGMTLDHSGTKIIFSIGLEDREAHFYLVDIDEIQSMLRSV